MKRCYLILLFTVLLVADSVAQNVKQPSMESIKKSVRVYLSKTLNDNKSYTPVSWGQIETYYTKYGDSDLAEQLTDSINDLAGLIKHIDEKIQERKVVIGNELKSDTVYINYLNSLKIGLDRFERLQKRDELASSRFKPTFNYFLIRHKFRAKNGYNATVLNHYAFVLNKNGIITEVNDLNEIDRKFRTMGH